LLAIVPSAAAFTAAVVNNVIVITKKASKAARGEAGGAKRVPSEGNPRLVLRVDLEVGC
jgi:hypothetical protein